MAQFSSPMAEASLSLFIKDGQLVKHALIAEVPLTGAAAC